MSDPVEHHLLIEIIDFNGFYPDKDLTELIEKAIYDCLFTYVTDTTFLFNVTHLSNKP